MCVGGSAMQTSGAGTTPPARGSPAGMARGMQFLAAFLQKQQGNSGPYDALRAQFQNNHGGMTARQMSQARRGTIPIGGAAPGTPGPSALFGG
jgi:hypothetical protein